MQRSVTIVLTAAIAAAALVACSGGKQSSSTTTTTTTTQTSPGASPAAATSPAASAAASPAASAATTTKTTTTTTKEKAPAGGTVAMSSAAAMQAGSKVYTTNCSSCHQANGKGQASVFPPLDGNPVVTGPDAKVISIVKDGLSGKITVGGATYNGQMPAWKGTLSDSDIAAVITYIRGSWSNKAGAVTAAQVTAAK